jgi:Cof subfamily protein (haloacid dehalogenase superfamily)
VTRDLLVCDLDGTLVDRSGAVDPGLVQAFHAAAARGLLISLATGRMPAGVDRYRDELGLTAPLIFYNGALVRDPRDGRDLLSHTLPRGLLREAYEVFCHAPVHPLFYRDDQIYCLERTYPVKEYGDQQGLTAEVIADPGSFLGLGAFVKALFMAHPATLGLLRPELAGLAGARARLVMTRTDYLEMIPAAASKGGALRCLASHLGVPLARVVAVGDQENDTEMIEAAGLGVAMPQAPAPVRQVADRVAPWPGEGGLLALLREILPAYFD